MADHRADHPPADAAAWWHTRLADDDDVHAALRRVAEAGCHLLSSCQAASVTIIELGRPVTVVSTGDAALAADSAQYDVDDGPCLAAARHEQVVLIDDVAVDDRWPHFGRAALAEGFRASLSIPLRLGVTGRGGLNLYGDRPGAFTEDDQDVATGFAAQASVVVANAQAYWAAFDATRNLTLALERRAVIEQAKGVLIARHGFSDDDAFDELRRRSQATNRKLRAIAAEVVDQARRDGHR
jgi:GAF domain-containing protein